MHRKSGRWLYVLGGQFAYMALALLTFFYLDYTTAKAIPTLPFVRITATYPEGPVTADQSVTEVPAAPQGCYVHDKAMKSTAEYLMQLEKGKEHENYHKQDYFFDGNLPAANPVLYARGRDHYSSL